MNKFLLILIVIAIIVSPVYSQDVGTLDTVILVGDTLIIGQSRPIEIIFVNDEPLTGYDLGLVVQEVDSGYAKFDSAVFINRMSDPTVIDLRRANSRGDNINGPDSIQFGGVRITGNLLPAGNSSVCLLYFTGMRHGILEIDSSLIGTTTKFLMIDLNSNRIIPQFTKKHIIVTEGSQLPSITISDTLVQSVANSEIELLLIAESPITTELTTELFQFTKYDSDDTPITNPSISNNNPAEFSWTPSSSDVGIWEAVFKSCDIQNNCSEKSITIQVVESDEYLIAYELHENPTHTRPINLNCVDVDNDGFVEIAIGGYPHQNSASFILYDLNITTDILSVDFVDDEIADLRGTQFGYLNTDNYLDFMGIRPLHNWADVYYNNQDNTFNIIDDQLYFDQMAIKAAVLNDFNNDQYLDYALIHGGKVILSYGTSNSQWSNKLLIPIDDVLKSIDASDFNRDGYNDFAVGGEKGLYILLNDQNGNFNQAFFYDQTFGIVDIDITNKGSDFNNDRRFDICMSVPSIGGEFSELVVYMGKETGGFFKKNITTVKGHIHGNTVGDFNNDGYLDIAFINGSQSYFSVLYGNGNGDFNNEVRYNIPDNKKPALIEATDLDLDGDVDIVITTSVPYGDNFIFHYYNLSDPIGMTQISFTLDCNNNAVPALVSPTGKEVNDVKNTVPSASLTQKNIDNNSSLDKYLKISTVETGAYQLHVSPNPALPVGSQFTTEFNLNNEPFRLAKNIPMSETGYTFIIYPSGSSSVNPMPGAYTTEKLPVFTWNVGGDVNLQLSRNIDFTDLVIDSLVSNSNLTLLSELSVSDTTTYFWRVKSTTQPSYDGIYVFNIVNKVATNVVDDLNELPANYTLSQNYPNPFNPTTSLNFSLPERANVSMEIYNIAGQKIRTLTNQEYPAGEHIVEWDGTDMNGNKTASGIYLMKFTTRNFSKSLKMIMMK